MVSKMAGYKERFICMIAIIPLFIAAGSAFAQSRRVLVDDIVAEMKQELKLSDDQTNKIKLVIANDIQRQQQIKEQAQGKALEAVKEQMQALRQDTESKLAQYLSPVQFTQWKNKQQLKVKLNGEENPGGGFGGGGFGGDHPGRHHRGLGTDSDSEKDTDI